MFLTDPQMDLVAVYRGRSVLIGLGLLIIPRICVPGQSSGVFTGLTLLALGIFALVLNRWRSDPGLWMLAALVLVIYGPVYIYLQCRSIAVLIRNVPVNARLNWIQLGTTLDSCTALLVFGLLVRFVTTVVAGNWRMSKRHARCQAKNSGRIETSGVVCTGAIDSGRHAR